MSINNSEKTYKESRIASASNQSQARKTASQLQGSAAIYLRCGGVANNHIKKGLLLSLQVKKIKNDEYLAKLQART